MKEEDTTEVLLIEDNPHDFELILAILDKYDLSKKVTLLRDGAEALDYLFSAGVYASREAKKSPRMIILDLKLPKVHGLEVLKRIRSDERTRAIPVVILTSSREELDKIGINHFGVSRYIQKPIKFDHFICSINKVVQYLMSLDKTV